MTSSQPGRSRSNLQEHGEPIWRALGSLAGNKQWEERFPGPMVQVSQGNGIIMETGTHHGQQAGQEKLRGLLVYFHLSHS